MITAVVFVLVAALGAVARAEAGGRWSRPGKMPHGTLLVNVVGSFLLGLLWNAGPPAFTVLGVAGLGTFTTFSGFARDVVDLVGRRQWRAAAAYVVVMCTLGVGAAALGVALARLPAGGPSG